MMPPPGLQIYLRTPNVDRFTRLPRGPLCQFLHQNPFTSFQNIVLTNLVTDKQTNERTDQEHNASVC